MPNGARSRRYVGVAGLVLVVDLVTKLAVEASFARGRVLPLMGDTLQFRLVYNPGAAFGLHLGPWSRWIFLVIAVVALVILTRMAWSSAPGDRLRQVALGMVAGGAAGNLVDRIRSTSGVVDFIDVGVGTLRWPTFNVADIGVSLGAIALALSLWAEDARARQHSAEPGSSP